VRGPLFPEPVQIIVAVPMGTSVKVVGKGLRTNRVYEPVLSKEQLALLTASLSTEPLDGDARKSPNDSPEPPAEFIAVSTMGVRF